MAAPFMFASTLAIGAVAKLHFTRHDLSRAEMKRAYDAEVKRAKDVFDPSRARAVEAREAASRAVAEERDEAGASAPTERAGDGDFAARLEKLRSLLERGLIDEAEYERTKARILDSI